MPKLKKHARVNDTWLGPLERRTLNWLAAHSPAWMTPDLYTSIGMFGTVTILAGFILSRFHPVFFWMAILGFCINWFGDSMDGTLARFRHIERPIYGFFIDHTMDAISQVLVFTGLGLSPYIHFNVAMFTLVGYLLLSVLVYIRTYVVSQFQISYNKLGPTEGRVLAILLCMIMFVFGERHWDLDLGALGKLSITPYDVIVGFVGFLLYYFFVVTAIQETIRLAKEDPGKSG